MKIAVIGAGSWGTALATLLAHKDNTEVALWARNPQLAAELNECRCNCRYLHGVSLPKTVRGTSSLEDALAGAEAVVLATPSKAVRATCEQLRPYWQEDRRALLLSKGLEPESGKLLLKVAREALGLIDTSTLCVLSGPNHAEEVARGALSATVVASRELACARYFQALCATESLRVYTSTDTTGVQLCGAAKNIIAIAAGAVAGSGLGDNTVAMLMTRGLAEISRLVEAAGGQQQTCMGLAGMGDLIVTCTSRHSRNRGFGVALAAGETLSSYEGKTHMVVEGALAAKTVTALAARHGVELPLCDTIRRVVWEDLSLEDMVPLLMTRPARPEFY